MGLQRPRMKVIVAALAALVVAALAFVALAVTPCACAPPALANTGRGATQEIRHLIADWYAELRKKERGNVRPLMAPTAINATPHYRHIDTGAASLGPRVYTSLAARALKFDYDIERLKIDPQFAKADVWERGYSYAWAMQKTTERAAATTFVFERREKDGRWQILAHQTSSRGIPPGKHTDPMPDLRDLYYATEGKDRDPVADARNALNR